MYLLRRELPRIFESINILANLSLAPRLLVMSKKDIGKSTTDVEINGKHRWISGKLPVTRFDFRWGSNIYRCDKGPPPEPEPIWEPDRHQCDVDFCIDLSIRAAAGLRCFTWLWTWYWLPCRADSNA